MHVVWICHRDLRDFLSFDDKAHMERKKADDHKIELPSEYHLKDVIKPQEEHFRGRHVDVAHARRHTHRIKWISGSFDERRLFSVDSTWSCSLLRSPDMLSSGFGGRIGSPATWINALPFIGTRSAKPVGGTDLLLEALAAFLAAKSFLLGLFLGFLWGRGCDEPFITPLIATPSVDGLSKGCSCCCEAASGGVSCKGCTKRDFLHSDLGCSCSGRISISLSTCSLLAESYG